MTAVSSSTTKLTSAESCVTGIRTSGVGLSLAMNDESGDVPGESGPFANTESSNLRV
jgi:hypothetical protein